MSSFVCHTVQNTITLCKPKDGGTHTYSDPLTHNWSSLPKQTDKCAVKHGATEAVFDPSHPHPVLG